MPKISFPPTRTFINRFDINTPKFHSRRRQVININKTLDNPTKKYNIDDILNKRKK